MQTIELLLEQGEQAFIEIEQKLTQILAKISTGKPSASLVDGILVDYYGALTPIKSIASVTVPDAQTIVIKPFDKQALTEIRKALSRKDELNPQDGQDNTIRIILAPLTEEKRKKMVKEIHAHGEMQKGKLRQKRDELRNKIKKQKNIGGVSEDDIFSAEKNLDQLSKKYTENMNALLKYKEEQLMKV